MYIYIWFLCELQEQHDNHFFFLRFTSTKKPSNDTSGLSNEDGISSLIQRSKLLPCISLSYIWCVVLCNVELGCWKRGVSFSF